TLEVAGPATSAETSTMTSGFTAGVLITSTGGAADMAVKPAGVKSAPFCTLNDEDGLTLTATFIVETWVPPGTPIVGKATSTAETAITVSGRRFRSAIFYLIVQALGVCA